MKEALRTLPWLAVIDLPLTFVVLQVIAGRSLGGQVMFVTTLTYLFLAGAAALYAAVLATATTPAATRRAFTTSRILLFEQMVTTTHDSGCHHRRTLS